MRTNITHKQKSPALKFAHASVCVLILSMVLACSDSGPEKNERAPDAGYASTTAEESSATLIQKQSVSTKDSTLRSKKYLWNNVSSTCQIASNDNRLEVALNWDKPQEKMLGYHVWRAEGLSDAWTRLTPNVQSATKYTDENVRNGSGYRYRVIGTPKSGGADVTVCDNAQAFVAISTAETQQCDAVEGPNKSVALSWRLNEPAQVSIEHRFRNKVAKDAFSEIHSTVVVGADGEYQHDAPELGSKNIYQIVPLQTFSNPYTQEDVILKGAPCRASLKLLSEASFALDNAVQVDGEDEWNFYTQNTEEAALKVLAKTTEDEVVMQFRLMQPKSLSYATEMRVASNTITSVSLPQTADTMVWSVTTRSVRNGKKLQKTYITSESVAVQSTQSLGNVTRGWHIDEYPAGTSLSSLSNAPIKSYGIPELHIPANVNNVIRAKAMLDIPADGDYCFFIDSNVNARLYFNNTVIVETSAGDGSVQSKMGCGNFLKGLRIIQIRQAATAGERHIRLHWKGPGRYWESLRGKYAYRDKLDASDDVDQDGDGFSDPIDRFPNKATEWFDQDSDTIGDHADQDVDGDGRRNETDLFPYDGIVEPSEPVNPLTLNFSESTKQLQLSWAPKPNDNYGFRVYRTDVDGANRILIADLLPSRTSHVINNVGNNSAHRYSLGFINSNGVDRPYFKDPVESWLAWNDQPISSCGANQAVSGAEIIFAPTTVKANIEKKLGSDAFSALASKVDSGFIDHAIRNGGVYTYRLHSVQTKQNPFRFVDEEYPSLVSCVTDPLTVASSMSVVLTDMTLSDNNAYVRDPAFVGDNNVTGAIAGALGPVHMQASSGATLLDFAISDNPFVITLPISDGQESWTIRVAETEAITPSAVELNALFVLDKVVPVIDLGAGVPALTYANSVQLLGKITDDKSGVASAIIQKDGMADIALGLQADGSFSANLPLSPSVNVFTLTAKDVAGNSVSEVFVVEQDRSLPVLQITEPSSGSSTYETSTVIRGSVNWRHALSALSLKINQQTVSLEHVGPAIQFSQSDIALVEGANTFELEISSPVGDVQSTIVVTRLVDNTAPVIVINPVAEPVTSEAHATITGNISDDNSGVERSYWLHSRLPGENGLLLDAHGNFSIDVPLDEGANTITVHANDRRGNASSKFITINREDRLPSLSLLEPVEGSITDQSSIIVKANVGYRGALADLILKVNGVPVTLAAAAQANEYRAQTSVALVSGANTVVVQLQYPLGVIEQSRRVTLDPDKANENDVPPELSVRRPLDQTVLSSDTHTIELGLRASARPITLTINGQVIDSIHWLDASTARISFPFAFTPEQNQLTILSHVTDQKNRQTSVSATYYRDAAAPIVEVDRFLPEPALNEVLENPVRVTGIVRDERLSGLTANGQPIGLQPGNNPGEHRFSTHLSMAPNMEQLLSLRAQDSAGNQTQKVYRFVSIASGGVKVLLPVANAEFIADSNEFPLSVAVQIQGEPSQTQVFAKVDSGDWVALEREGAFAQGTVNHPATEGLRTLSVELRANDGRVLATDSRSYNLKSLANIPLEVVRVQPENGARDVEPNEFVAVHFNKPIDPSKFSFTVDETAHGMTYQNLDPLGTDFTQAKGSQLVEISRSRAAVPGEVSIVPGSRSVAFYPKRDVAYAGEIFVEAKYDNEVVARFAYSTRALPTLLGGIIVDPLGQAVPGISVALPQLNRTAITDIDGAFSFGFEDKAAQSLPEGRQLFVVNPQQKSSSYASQQQWITLQQGRVNDLGIITVPPLNPDVGYRLAQGGEPSLTLAEGDLRLDLSEAQLLFPDGKRQGNIHAQFLSFHEFGKPFAPYAIPHWIFNLQPEGIRIQGDWKLSLTMPKLNDSYDYLVVPDFYVVIVGADEDGKGIVPIGVGRLQNAVVTSVGKLQSNRLDQIGVALVNFDLQEQLQKYAEGELSWVALESAIIDAGKQ